MHLNQSAIENNGEIERRREISKRRREDLIPSATMSYSHEQQIQNGNCFEIYFYLCVGGKLSTLSLEPSSLDDIRQEIAKIASLYGVFQCVECSQAIKEFLTIRKVHGKQIKLDLGRQDLPWSVIYDLRRGQQIATNGYHIGISITVDEEEIVFDNIDRSGVNRPEWLQNLTSPTLELGMGSFKIIEEEF
ncbi:papain fold toxin domain-containing protein [Microcoleus sp. ARI1-B5]|uniref:papain fold toxin domain-containing protein n=1 Tax=unclassified Microcoleus TaxID=2642155 RepID=UPI002FD1E694